MAADEIDYQVIGDDLQAVIITLDPGEAVFAEAGAMMFMREGITMATTLDPNSKSGGLFDKLVGAGKRVLAGDSFFVTLFGNSGARRADVAFAAPYPGKIVPSIWPIGSTVMAQKDSFRACARNRSRWRSREDRRRVLAVKVSFCRN
jgi:uncharacterized protein (AIM24 family)